MKATRINNEHAKEVINNVKSVIRLGGFETGLRTNLNKAIKFCNGSYSTTYSSPEYLFEKEYQLEIKTRFTNFLNESYEIWFEESKIYTFENEGEKFLIVTKLGYCNVYQLIQKDEEKRFNDQPAITDNGDSKVTSISFKGKLIKIKCLLSNTKVCKWDKKYPENHNHYIITVSYEGKRLSFDWFDSFHNFRYDIIDKDRNEIIEMFYSYLQDVLYKNKYNRVFADIDIYELANYLQETFEF